MTVLVSLCFIMLTLIARILWINTRNQAIVANRASKDATDIVLLLRGVKAVLVDIEKAKGRV